MIGAEDKNADAGLRAEARELTGEAPDLVLARGEFSGKMKREDGFAHRCVERRDFDGDRLADIAGACARDRAQGGGIGGAGSENFT